MLLPPFIGPVFIGAGLLIAVPIGLIVFIGPGPIVFMFVFIPPGPIVFIGPGLIGPGPIGPSVFIGPGPIVFMGPGFIGPGPIGPILIPVGRDIIGEEVIGTGPPLPGIAIPPIIGPGPIVFIGPGFIGTGPVGPLPGVY